MATASQRLFERAIEAHRRGALAEARSLYDQALRADPANVAATVRFVVTQPDESVIPEIMVLPMRETSWP